MFVPISGEGSSFPFFTGDVGNLEKLCDCSSSLYCNCGEPLTFIEKVRRELGEWWYFLLYLGLVILISVFITLGMYVAFRIKHYDNPFKRAIKFSWIWRIVVFLLPIVVLLISVGVLFLRDKLS